MPYNVSPFFKEYEELALKVDKIFQTIQSQCSKEVNCHIGCVDCCYALFDLSLIEAMYINHIFYQLLPEEERKAALARADHADRKNFKIKYRAHKSYKEGAATDTILREVGKERVRCPLLADDNTCLLYEHRPITCRLYGIPMSIGDEVHSCKHSSFEPGGKYPSVYVDTLQKRLLDITVRFVESIPTRFTKLPDVFVPLSMALLNDYTDEYLGIVEENSKQTTTPESIKDWTLGNPEGD